ncbi:MAG TPA: hypothetical protein VFM21_12005 [Terriglobia bacterium]|nr:hypothetical protein [Terriglobia bacterium]
MRRFAILSTVLALAMISCAPQESLNPLCTNEEAIAEPALAGDWQLTDSDDVFEIVGRWQALAAADPQIANDPSSAPPDSRSYAILYIEAKSKRVSAFEGRLVRIGDDFFLDVIPTQVPVDADFKYFPVARSEDGAPPQFTRVSELFFMTLVPSQPGESSASQDGPCEIRLVAAHVFLKIQLEDDGLRLAWLDRDWMQEMIEQGRISIDHQQTGDTMLLTASPESLQDLVQQFSNDPQAFKEIGEWRRKR